MGKGVQFAARGCSPTFPGAANPFKVVRHPQRENHGLLQELLGILQVRDLVPSYRYAPLDDVSLCRCGWYLGIQV